MIQLFQESIFNSKCDLIIIPCNDKGGMTRSIKRGLETNHLPHLDTSIKSGEVAFIQTENKLANASMIGYAASVDTNIRASNKNILHSILRSIKEYCQKQSFRKVNIPLLGTGAGGLSAKVSYEVMKSEFLDDSSILLCVYTTSSRMYNELISEKKTEQNKNIKNPRVFISYTSKDSQNSKWVKNFACRLRRCGVNARLDKLHLKPGQDLPQWMANELIMADKVLLICDKNYAEKADNRKGGVGWETMIIQEDMLANQEQNKYIAILKDSDINQSLPLYIKSKYALNWSTGEITDKDFNELLLYLFDCDIEPPIGEIPDFVKEKLPNM